MIRLHRANLIERDVSEHPRGSAAALRRHACVATAGMMVTTRKRASSRFCRKAIFGKRTLSDT